MKSTLSLFILFVFALSSNAQNNTVKDELVYTAVEHSAEFPKGLAHFYQYISNNIKLKGTVGSGRIIASFVIEKDGHLSQFKILKSLSPEMDTELISVLKASPKWKPARQGRITVRQLYTIPVIIN